MSLSDFGFLVQNFAALVDWRYVAMWVIGGVLIFLAIKYEMEPTLLLPLGFGTILVNIPFSGAVDRMFGGELQEGALSTLYKAGINNELFPLILFIGIGYDRLRSPAFKPQAYDIRRGGSVRYFLYILRGFNVF